MGLDLKAVPAIAGENPKVIRDILRRCHGYLTENWLRKKLGFSREKAHRIATGLLRSGYVESAELDKTAYTVTAKGRNLMRASSAARIRRNTARSSLDEFMVRVRRVNESSAYVYSVVKVAVFGSFLRSDERVGDVDVAVDLKPRIPLEGNWVEIFQQHARNSGRSFRTFEEEIDWPRREVMLALKARKRSISIQSWFSFIEMEKPADFRYEVLLGVPRTIRSEVLRSRLECGEETSQMSAIELQKCC